MRFSPAAIALSLAFATVSSVGYGQAPSPDLKPRSVLFYERGVAAQQAGDFDGAIDSFETALAVDPRNGNAYIALAEISDERGLHGKAIRFYREALALDPNDLEAIAGQGESMANKGAIEKAKQNLARLETLCHGSCEQAGRLATVIERRSAQGVRSAQAVQPNPTISEQP